MDINKIVTVLGKWNPKSNWKFQKSYKTSHQIWFKKR